jgi:hypothetical protein
VTKGGWLGGKNGDGVDLTGRGRQHPLRGGEEVHDRSSAAGERRRRTHGTRRRRRRRRREMLDGCKPACTVVIRWRTLERKLASYLGCVEHNYASIHRWRKHKLCIFHMLLVNDSMLSVNWEFIFFQVRRWYPGPLYFANGRT